MKVAADRVRTKVAIRLRFSSQLGAETKYLEQGAYVKVIDAYYLPKGFDIPYSVSTEDVVYSQFGIGIIPKGATEKER